MAENIKSRKNYRIYNGTDWDTMHFVTDANSVDANDGDTMETKVGAIKGITTSTGITEEGYAADAKTVSELSSSLINENAETFNFGILDGKRGFFTDPLRGADSFVPFKAGGSSAGFGIDDEIEVLYTKTSGCTYTATCDCLAISCGSGNNGGSSKTTGTVLASQGMLMIAILKEGDTFTITSPGGGGRSYSGNSLNVFVKK